MAVSVPQLIICQLSIILCLLRHATSDILVLPLDGRFIAEEFRDVPSTFGNSLPYEAEYAAINHRPVVCLLVGAQTIKKTVFTLDATDQVLVVTLSKPLEQRSDMLVPWRNSFIRLRGMVLYANPPDACNSLQKRPDVPSYTGKWIILISRSPNNCSFEHKVRMAQNGSYDGVIVHNVGSDALEPMSAKNSVGITIPSVFVSETTGNIMKQLYCNADYFIIINSEMPFNINTHLLLPFVIVVGICFIVMVIFMIVKFIKDRRRQRRHRLSSSALNKIPTCKFAKGDPYDTCAICLEDYVEGEKLRVLPCAHAYHSKCIDPWLTKNRRVCPVCKRKVFAQDEPHSDSDSDTDDTTPLMNPTNRTSHGGGTFEEQTENPFQRAARSVSQQAEGVNLVTASDHHSINGEIDSGDESSSDGSTAGLIRADTDTAFRPIIQDNSTFRGHNV